MVESVRAAFFDLQGTDRASDHHAALLELVDRHRAAGDLLVLVVSGPRPSVHGPSAPLSQDPLRIRPDVVLVLDGPDTLTESPPVVVVEAICRLGLDPARCFGYADHVDGLRTLTVVGNPRVLGGDHQLAAAADDRGWPRLEPWGTSGRPARPPEPVPPAP